MQGGGDALHHFTFPSVLSIKVSHYVIGGLSLVTALAWNSSIRSAIDAYCPIPNKIAAGFVYAIIITIVLIIIIYNLPDTTSELPAPVKERISQIRDFDHVAFIHGRPA